MLDKVIDKITEEVEKRVVSNLENLKFNITVTVSKGDEDESMQEVSGQETNTDV